MAQTHKDDKRIFKLDRIPVSKRIRPYSAHLSDCDVAVIGRSSNHELFGN